MTIGSALRTATTGLAVFALVFQPTDANAAKKRSSREKSSVRTSRSTHPSSGKKTIALTAFGGFKASELRDWVRAAIEDVVTITDAEDANPKKPADFATLASELNVDAVVVGRQRTGFLQLTVRDADGKLVKNISVKAKRGPKLKAAIEAQLPNLLSKALERVESVARPEPEPAPEPEPEPTPTRKRRVDSETSDDEGDEEDEEDQEDEERTDDDEEEKDADEDGEEDEEEDEKSESPAETSPKRGGIGAPFVVDLGVRFQNRNLAYHDQPDSPRTAQSVALQDHSLKLGTLFFVDLGVYGGLFSDGFISNLGLIGGLAFGPPVPSKYTGENDAIKELSNKTLEWYVGSRFRIPIGAHELGLGVAYGQHKFEIAGDEASPLVLDTHYGYLRPAADAWFSMGPLFLGLDLGFRYVLGAGELAEEWFPKASVIGVDAGLCLGWELSPFFSLMLGADYTRYALTLNPKSNATRVAGSAIDQYISGSLGARFAFGSRSPVKASAKTQSDPPSPDP